MAHRNKRNSYNFKTLDFKKSILLELENGTPACVLSQREKIPGSTLSTWLKNKEKIFADCAKMDGCAIARNKIKLYLMKKKKALTRETIDEALYIWFKQARSKHLPLNGSILCSIANQFADDFQLDRISQSWVETWKARHRISKLNTNSNSTSTDQQISELEVDTHTDCINISKSDTQTDTDSIDNHTDTESVFDWEAENLDYVLEDCSESDIRTYNIDIDTEKLGLSHRMSFRYDIIPPKVLDAVQMSHIFPDSKTFVDKPLRATTDEISQAFNALPQPLSTKHLKEFVEKYFDEEGNDLESIVPTDFNESPKFLETIEDNRLKKFAFSLNQKWKNLGMKIKPGVQWSGKKNSLLYMPHPFIVPGGRFREIYYWDSFWVMKGLLVCDMTETVKGMLGNMLFMVDKYGFIPNGNREYYKNRSQPPLLIPMVHIYLEKTGDTDFLRKNFKLLEKEYNFWVTNRSVSVKVEDQVYEASMYRVATDSPRPESYREDKTLALSNPAAPAGQLYADLASAAESGWDFSTRWFKINRPITELDSIATRDVVPVDLNAFLCWNARLLRDFSQILGNTDRVTHYSSEYLRRLTLIDALFWDETAGAWFDYHLGSEARDVRFYASMITPMFTDCHGLTTAEKEGKVQRVMNYVKRTLGNFEGYQAGVPTSLFMSGQQWDYPNAWPPLQHMWIHSFHQSKNPEANNLASSLAEKWVTSNYMKWRPKQYMYEKYNAVTGEVGYGGEYQVQEGFGWSNGVILDLLSTFPKLTLPQNLVEVTVEADAVVSVSKLS